MAKAKILIVEDELYTAEGIKILLARGEYDPIAEVARNRQDALYFFEKYRPDLILMDIHLEHDTSGIEIAREIKEKFQVPIIFLTAYYDSQTLKSALDIEPDGYIVKPVSNETDLIPGIELALLKKKGMNRTLNNGEESPKAEKIENIEAKTRQNVTTDLDLIPKIAEILQNHRFLSIAEFFNALSNETRIQILFLLSSRYVSFDEIVQESQKATGTVSHHLSALEDQGLITIKREGKSSFFQTSPKVAVQLEKLIEFFWEPNSKSPSALDRLFFALANEDRLNLIQFLCERNGTTEDFLPRIPKTLATVSRHINILRDANLIRIAKNSKPIEYALNPQAVLHLLKIFQDHYGGNLGGIV